MMSVLRHQVHQSATLPPPDRSGYLSLGRLAMVWDVSDILCHTLNAFYGPPAGIPVPPQYGDPAILPPDIVAHTASHTMVTGRF